MNGAVLWTGPSVFNGEPIVVVVTGLRQASGNTKTGAMRQTWVLMQDLDPVNAIRGGAEAGICGTCRHRPTVEGRRSCYVGMFAPQGVWRCWQRGGYPMATPAVIDDIQRAPIRLGSYGDPAAAPVSVWTSLVGVHPGVRWTGYTQDWESPRSLGLRSILMASVGSPEEAQRAQALGWRTFRVRRDGRDPLLPGEFECPAAIEQGYRMDCVRCGACGGNPRGRVSAGNPAILAHRGYSGTVPLVDHRQLLLPLEVDVPLFQIRRRIAPAPDWTRCPMCGKTEGCDC